MLAPEGIAGALRGHFEKVPGALKPGILANRRELHLGSDDPAPGIVNLGDSTARFGPQNGSPSAVEISDRVPSALAFRLQPVSFRKVTVIHRLRGAPRGLDNIASLPNPSRPDGGQAPRAVAMESRVAPRPRGIIYADGLIGHFRSVREPCRGKRDLTHRNAQVGPRPGHINAARSPEEAMLRGGGDLV